MSSPPTGGDGMPTLEGLEEIARLAAEKRAEANRSAPPRRHMPERLNLPGASRHRAAAIAKTEPPPVVNPVASEPPPAVNPVALKQEISRLEARLAALEAEAVELAEREAEAGAEAASAPHVLSPVVSAASAVAHAVAAAAAPAAPEAASSSSSSGIGRDEDHAVKILGEEARDHHYLVEGLARHFAAVVVDSSLANYHRRRPDTEFQFDPDAEDAATKAAREAVETERLAAVAEKAKMDAEAAAIAAGLPLPADLVAPTRFSIEFGFDSDDDDEEKNPQPNDKAYGNGGGVFSPEQEAEQASRVAASNTVTDFALRYLGSFIDRVCVTMGMSAADTDQAMDWSDRAFRTRQWSDSYKAVDGIGYNDEDTMNRIAQRLKIKQDFDREVLQRLGSVRYAVTSALFWIQNRQGHTALRLWDIIHSETWCVWFLDLVSILHSVNNTSVRTAWQIKALRGRYKELEEWFEQNYDFGPPPVIPGGYYKFQLRPPVARTTFASTTDAEHVQDIQMLIQQATGDVDLTLEQTEHLVHTAMTKHFTGLSLKSLLRRTHSKIVFAQLLAVTHALSDTILHNKRLHKRKLGQAFPTAHMTLFITQQCVERIKWLHNFQVHGCACIS